MAFGSEGGFLKGVRNAVAGALALGGGTILQFDGYNSPAIGSTVEARKLRVGNERATNIGEDIADSVINTSKVQAAGDSLRVGEKTELPFSKTELNDVVKTMARKGEVTYKEAVVYCQNVDYARIYINKKTDEIVVTVRYFSGSSQKGPDSVFRYPKSK